MYDLVVVGGSVAGSAAAIWLRRLGRRVLVLEPRAFPRRKVCGEGVLPAGVQELDALGLREAAFERGQALRRIRFQAGANTVEAPLSPSTPGLGIRRTELDPLLWRAAGEAGAETVQATVSGLEARGGLVHGVVTRDGRLFEGRAVLAADGIHSRVRRLAGLDSNRVGRRFGVAAHAAAPVESDVIHVRFLGGREIYLTPVGSRSVNVVELVNRRTFRQTGARSLQAIGDEMRLAAGLESHAIEEPLAVAGPFPRRARRAWRGNVVLVGDAAGFFDGITGDGMSIALASARIAAHALDRWLDTADPGLFAEYDRARRRLVRSTNLLGRISLALGSRQSVAERAIANLARHPATFERFVQISGREAGWNSLRPRDLVHLLAGR